MSRERHFRAMGSSAHVLVAMPAGADGAGDALLDAAVERIELLEQAWSRFRPTSDLTHLNTHAGLGPVESGADLRLLVTTMREAWELTGGLFDPTVLPSMTALGYDADFATVAARTGAAGIADVLPAPGMSGVRVDDAAGTITLPGGVELDPGAIGKGLAADLVCADLIAAGATGALVNLGGDLALLGEPDGSPHWSIAVEDERQSPDSAERLLRVIDFAHADRAAGVATSTVLKRRWAQGRRHHVIDPRTGTMSTGELVHVTVVAGCAWQAEVLATAALLLPAETAAEWLRERAALALLVTDAGDVLSTDAAVAA